MDMATMTTATATTATTEMVMAATSMAVLSLSPAMAGMNMSPSSNMSGSSMAMTFFESLTTPLFWSAWQPDSPGAYAGTCLFLIALSVLARVLIAFKPILEETTWKPQQYHRLPVAAHQDRNQQQQQHLLLGENKDDAEQAMFLPASMRPMGRAVRNRWHGATLFTRVCRALYDVLLTGVGYLLMLAVMTYNVGYFLSVLGGIFLGTFILGNLATEEGSNRWHASC